ncbi:MULTISPECIES: carbohydrate ABC transporter permease [unclassified Petrotoga]|uniref:carbohydrate ABC transporter permease n=1 Tax=unclassified Petrotoga TaxID=2620614 RepID=UPI000CB52DF5|nr:MULTISPECIES: carbohydrate ABC transporter permease [unclassified Petrotoga]PNR90744.1 ABC transporter permease [Petrotoga sp. HWHPT.55.6.3]
MSKSKIIKVLSLTIVVIALIWTLYPLMWILFSSFKTPIDQFTIPPKWIPENFTLRNYKIFFSNTEFVRAFFNSIIVTASSTILALILGIPAAYGLARFKWKHTSLLSFIILLARMTPPIVMVLPFFLISRILNLSGTYIPIIIASSFFSVPFAVWMMQGFFSEIPESLEEAAMIDGCTRFESLRKIVLPLVLPGISATSILCALVSWNEFLFALILTGQETRTLPVLVNMFVSEKNVDWGVMSAASLITVIPMIIFGLLVQNNLVRGLTAGSGK